MANSNRPNHIRVGRTAYKYVTEFICTNNGKRVTYYSGFIRKESIRVRSFVSAKAAALQMDIKLIEKGMPPVNILKKKLDSL